MRTENLLSENFARIYNIRMEQFKCRDLYIKNPLSLYLLNGKHQGRSLMRGGTSRLAARGYGGALYAPPSELHKRPS